MGTRRAEQRGSRGWTRRVSSHPQPLVRDYWGQGLGRLVPLGLAGGGREARRRGAGSQAGTMLAPSQELESGAEERGGKGRGCRVEEREEKRAERGGESVPTGECPHCSPISL